MAREPLITEENILAVTTWKNELERRLTEEMSIALSEFEAETGIPIDSVGVDLLEIREVGRTLSSKTVMHVHVGLKVF